VIFSRGYISMTVRPAFAAWTKSRPPERTWAIACMPTVRSMSATDTPLLARFTTIASRSRMRSSLAMSRSCTAARSAGTSGVTGTRILSERSKIARFRALYDGCRSTTT
jgi:hypothetical protein